MEINCQEREMRSIDSCIRFSIGEFVALEGLRKINAGFCGVARKVNKIYWPSLRGVGVVHAYGVKLFALLTD